MSESFDPYYTWLGIPPKEQPPNAYRLLGIQRYESNRDVIAHAVDRQMAHVKSQAIGPYAEWSQTLLNKLAKAKTTLLNEDRKKTYDADLRKREQASAPQVKVAQRVAEKVKVAKAVPLEDAAPTAGSSSTGPVIVTTDSSAGGKTRNKTSNSPDANAERVKRNKQIRLAGHIAAPILGLGLGYLILCLIMPSKDTQPETVAEAPSDYQTTRKRKRPRVIRRSDPDAQRPQKTVRLKPEPVPATDTSFPEPQRVPTDNIAIKVPSFATVPKYVDLPPVASSEAIKLADVPLPDGESLELDLAGAPIPDGEGLRFRLDEAGETSQQAGSPKLWDISLNGLTPSGTAPGKIAHLAHRDNGLHFRWATSSNPLVGFLRNCVLVMSVGDEQRSMYMRVPQKVGPLRVLLKERTVQIPVDAAYFPDASQVYLEVLDPSVFARARTLYAPSNRRVAFGEEIEIELFTEQTAKLRLSGKMVSGTPAIELRADYTLGSTRKEYEFTVTRVNKQLVGFRKQLIDAEKDYNKAIATRSQASTQQRFLRGKSFPSSGPGRAAAARNQQQINQLNGQISKMNKKLASIQKKVPDLQSHIKALEPIIQMGNNLHLHARIHYRVCLMLDNHEVDLVVTDATIEPDTREFQKPSSSDSPSIALDTKPVVTLEQFQQSQQQLEADPADAAANKTAGLYHCLVKGDWQTGLPHLQRCDDVALAAAAQLDMQSPTESKQQVEVGDAWYKLGESGKLPTLQRAGMWYQKAYPMLTGLSKLKVERRQVHIREKLKL